MAEFLQTGTATHPHTYWKEIKHLNAGSSYRFIFGSDARFCEGSTYWLPAYFDSPPISDRREIVARLADALSTAVRRRTQPLLGKVAVMLSSGADSRTALFGACDPGNVTCYTLYDEPNEELRGAQRLASVAGARHVAIQRSIEYYIENATEAVRVSGGMWTVASAHYGGALNSVLADSPGVVLTGCYADYLLKGIAFNRRAKTFLGRDLPIYNFSEFSYQWHHDYYPLPGQYGERVMKRMTNLFGVAKDKYNDNPSFVEFLRLSPIVREPDASGRLFLQRKFPSDFFMSDNDVLSLFGSIDASEKLNGVPFGMAVSQICGKAASKVPNNNFGAPVGANEIERVVAFVFASLKRKFLGKGSGQPFENNSLSIATAGSWPYYPRVIEKSQRLRSWRETLPADQAELLFEMVGRERQAWTNNEWAKHAATLFIRLYTASLWLSKRSTRMPRRS
jgi:asparagine synthase (glutamine-hydrolysing)